jgi:hypothetical protein
MIASCDKVHQSFFYRASSREPFHSWVFQLRYNISRVDAEGCDLRTPTRAREVIFAFGRLEGDSTSPSIGASHIQLRSSEGFVRGYGLSRYLLAHLYAFLMTSLAEFGSGCFSI